jgi:hypothetical protein
MSLVLNALHGCRGADMDLEKNTAALVTDACSRPNIAIERVGVLMFLFEDSLAQ